MTRTSATKKTNEKSPVLNVRKNNTINAALKANLHVDQQKKQKPTEHASSPLPPQPIHSVAIDNNAAEASSDDDSDHINIDKLKKIRSKAAQK